MTRAIADACAAAGARLVLADNLYMYGPVTGPISEETQQHPSSHKGRVRRAMADELLGRNRAGDLEVTIGRASDYYGPGGRDSTPGVLVFAALAKGRRPRWMGALDQPHTLHYLPDAGRALVALGDAPDAGGQAWILPADRPRTGTEWLQLALQAARRTGAPAAIRPWQNKLAGLFVRQVRELNEIMDQFTAPFVTDAARFVAQFGEEGWITPVEEAMAETVGWFSSHRGS
jgi:nucleoside-diphosphate-sugar epimerase